VLTDHRNDPKILARWLSNKTPEIVASWIAQPGNSLPLAVDGGVILAVGSVTDEGEITLIMCHRTQGFAASVGLCWVHSKRGRSNDVMPGAPSPVARPPADFIFPPGIVRTVLQFSSAGH
jgi:hypothetical protein